jgi:hypothetical protein
VDGQQVSREGDEAIGQARRAMGRQELVLALIEGADRHLLGLWTAIGVFWAGRSTWRMFEPSSSPSAIKFKQAVPRAPKPAKIPRILPKISPRRIW